MNGEVASRAKSPAVLGSGRERLLLLPRVREGVKLPRSG